MALRPIKTANSLRRLSRGRSVFVACALLVPLGVLAAISIGIQRSFLIDAHSSVLQITFDGANAWSFPEATICLPRDIPDRNAQPRPGEVCSAIDQAAQQIESLTIPWPDRTVVTLRAEAGAIGTRLRIILPDGMAEEYPPNTEIVLDPAVWQSNGALLFSGNAVLGTVLGSRERYYLHSAHWEARQTSLITGLLRSATDTVMSGDAIRGAQISVAIWDWQQNEWGRERRSATIFGHVTPIVAVDGLPAFAVTLVSEPGRTELNVGHYGLDDMATIRPDIIDTAASSVLLIAAIAVISLAAAATQVIADLMFSGRDVSPTKRAQKPRATLPSERLKRWRRK